MERPTIVLIGSGNVATHLAKALDANVDIVQVYSRDFSNAKALSDQLTHCSPTDDLKSLVHEADFYIISVKDDAIPSVAKELGDVTGMVVHTSGATEMDVLSTDRHNEVGVMYPLQTFSKDVNVDVTEIPFFLEASSRNGLDKLKGLVTLMSQKIYEADSNQRRALHVAAVFGCNFINHMLDISSEILNDNGYTLDVLKPLITTTIDKALTNGPHRSQTGPAVRHDEHTMERHIEILNSDRANLYREISESIIDMYDKDPIIPHPTNSDKLKSNI